MLNSKSFSDKFYSSILNEREKANNESFITYRKVLEMIPSKGRVLDIGCFNGYLIQKIQENSTNYDVFGVDASKKAVDYCKEKGLKVFETDAEGNLPFEDNYFDIVTGLEIIEHIVDTDSFLIEIKRVLKKDGVLILTTPNVLSLGRRLMTLFGINPFFEASYSYPPGILSGHVRYYSHYLLKNFLEFHNYKVLENKSDVVNFSNNQDIQSEFLAKLFPRIGRGVLIKAINIK